MPRSRSKSPAPRRPAEKAERAPSPPHPGDVSSRRLLRRLALEVLLESLLLCPQVLLGALLVLAGIALQVLPPALRLLSGATALGTLASAAAAAAAVAAVAVTVPAGVTSRAAWRSWLLGRASLAALALPPGWPVLAIALLPALCRVQSLYRVLSVAQSALGGALSLRATLLWLLAAI